MSAPGLPYAVVLFAFAAAGPAIAAAVWQRRDTPGARPFTALVIAAATWAAMSGCEHASLDPPTKVLFAKLEYPGIVSVAPLWLVFVLAYTGQRGWLRPPRLAALFVVPAITVALAWTNEWHRLVWTTIAPSSGVPGAPLVYGHGVWFWVAATHSYVCNVAGAVVLLRAIHRHPRHYRPQTVTLIAGLALPWIGNALYLTRTSPLGGVDPTPLAFTLTGALYAWGIFRLRLFDLVPVARDVLIEQMADGVVLVDARNRILDINPSARAMIGLGDARVVGTSVETVLGAWPHLVARYRDVRDARAEVLVDTQSGPRYLDLRISPLADEEGRFHGRLIVFREITAMRQADDRLRLQSVALDEAGNAIFITRRDGTIIWVNRAFSELTGYQPDEVIGQTPRVLKSGAHDAGFYRRLWDTLASGEFWRGEIVNRRKDGRGFTADQTIAPVHDGRGDVDHYIAIMQDVTARKAVERMREDLTRSFVHDLRNPLANIRTSLDLLVAARRRPVAVEPAAALEIAQASAMRMWRLLDSILDISRLEAGQMPLHREPTAIGPLVRDTLELQEPVAAQKHITLVNAVAADLPRVAVDAGLIGRVLQNLVDNAIRFTPEGGTVRIGAWRDPDASEVTVTVIDTGPGLPPGLHDYVFDRPAVGRAPGRGSGLGLVFCRLAVEAHGGRIRAERGAPRGAVFSFTLPVATSESGDANGGSA